MLSLKQTGTVEDYTTQFQALQFEVTMHSSNIDELFFATTYVNGLKDDVRVVVEPHVPTNVRRAATIAKIQQRQLERNKLKYQRAQNQARPQQRQDTKPNIAYANLWRDKQLRDYRKANNLCYHCGDKFEPGHAKVCTKRNKPQLNALIVNELDKEIAVQELLTEDFGQLSLNALARTTTPSCIQLKATVKNKTMLILVDTGSSHSFVSSHFVTTAQLPTVPIAPQKIKLPNGEWMTTVKKVANLSWLIQGHTFHTDMIVLDRLPYDAILGYDWLQTNSPMNCDWQAKTLQFTHSGKLVTLHGLQDPPSTPGPILEKKQVYKSSQGNDI
jgi:hypothetical protein